MSSIFVSTAKKLRSIFNTRQPWSWPLNPSTFEGNGKWGITGGGHKRQVTSPVELSALQQPLKMSKDIYRILGFLATQTLQSVQSSNDRFLNFN